MSAMFGPVRYLNRKLSEESRNSDAEFVFHVDGEVFETDNS